MEGIEFLDFNYINDDIIKKLDNVAKKVITSKQYYKIPYDFLEKALLCYVKNNEYKYEDVNKILRVKPLKKWEIMTIALEFYKSIDYETYEGIRDIIFNQNPKIRSNIYKLSKIKNFSEQDFEFEEFKKYSKIPQHHTVRNRDMMYLPLSDTGQKGNAKEIREDEGTIDDLYSIVHELGHTLDLYLNYIISNTGIIISDSYDPGNNLLTESTSIALERALTSYLLEKKLIDAKDAEEIFIKRKNDTLNSCYFAYTKLVLARKKQENSVIYKKDIDEIANNMKLGIREKNNLVNFIMESDGEILINARYAFSGILSPTIEKVISQGRINKFKQYLEESRKGNVEKALHALDITADDEGLKILYNNMVNQRFDFERDRVECNSRDCP